MKCEKCGYISFDYNVACPSCNKDLNMIRRKLGLHYMPPEVDFDEYFTGSSSSYRAAAPAAAPKRHETELDLDSGEEFEFTLDD